MIRDLILYGGLLAASQSDEECKAALVKQEPAGIIAANAVAALLFLICLSFALYILIKYLIIDNKFGQMSMILFYVFSILDLLTRVTFLIMSCFFENFSKPLRVLQTVSTILSISSGVAHAHNLSLLLLDLESVQFDSFNSFMKVKQ